MHMARTSKLKIYFSYMNTPLFLNIDTMTIFKIVLISYFFHKKDFLIFYSFFNRLNSKFFLEDTIIYNSKR